MKIVFGKDVDKEEGYGGWDNPLTINHILYTIYYIEY
jgi:hypothetical protein